MKKKSESAGKNGIGAASYWESISSVQFGDDERMAEVYVRKISAKMELWNGKWQLSADPAVLVAKLPLEGTWNRGTLMMSDVCGWIPSSGEGGAKEDA
jgi:hypothetical protein